MSYSNISYELLSKIIETSCIKHYPYFNKFILTFSRVNKILVYSVYWAFRPEYEHKLESSFVLSFRISLHYPMNYMRIYDKYYQTYIY